MKKTIKVIILLLLTWLIIGEKDTIINWKETKEIRRYVATFERQFKELMGGSC